MRKVLPEIILASASPRRRELFAYFDLPFKVVVPRDSVEKDRARTHQQARRLVVENALNKAMRVAKDYPEALVIGADTVVFCKGRLFGKPKDLSTAKEYLRFLSHNPHQVYTGIALWYSGKVWTDVEKTKVFMDPLKEEEIEFYFSKEPVLDKAGGFGIQGFAGTFITRIEGCFYNVMGLPLSRLRRLMITALGYNPFVSSL